MDRFRWWWWWWWQTLSDHQIWFKQVKNHQIKWKRNEEQKKRKKGLMVKYRLISICQCYWFFFSFVCLFVVESKECFQVKNKLYNRIRSEFQIRILEWYEKNKPKKNIFLVPNNKWKWLWFCSTIEYIYEYKYIILPLEDGKSFLFIFFSSSCLTVLQTIFQCPKKKLSINFFFIFPAK